MERLQKYAWPGNIRELQNVAERAAILSPGPTLELDGPLLASASSTGANFPGQQIASSGRLDKLEDVERSH
jgi:DNA-binding NtrC family response regulator